MKIIFFFVLILLSALILRKITPAVNEKPKVVIGNATIFVDIAETSEEKQRGLSGQSSLAKDGGMLFLFNNDAYQSFWMKDMLFSIDIIWINNGKIIYIHENVDPPQPGIPDSKLSLYTPPTAIDKVLEVNAGFSEKHGIKVGDVVDFSGI